MPVICPICGAVLPDLMAYYDHVAMEHAGLPIPPPLEAFPPTPPPEEPAPTPPAEIVPTPTPPVPEPDVYLCPTCGAVFLSEMEVREHQAVEHAGVTPAPVVPAPASEVEAMQQYGKPGDLTPDAAKAEQLNTALKAVLKSAGITDESLEKVLHSPADPVAAAEMARNIAAAGALAVGVFYSIGIIAEIASLGQLEKISDRQKDLIKISGAEDIITGAAGLPIQVAIIGPATQYWNSIVQANLPGAGDLIRFVVREVITASDFVKWMKFHGFSSDWSSAYWEAHWVLPARGEVVEAYHRGLITREEYEKYIVWHDYKPEPRPGISKSDMEVLAGLMKELIPRVDLRRAWELGIIEDDRLLKGYQDLGYEDDAPLMVEIQKAISLGAERGAVARVAGRCYRDDKIPESRFREELTKMGIGGEAQDLWVLRFQWEKMAKPTKAEEQAEEVTGGAAGEVP